MCEIPHIIQHQRWISVKQLGMCCAGAAGSQCVLGQVKEDTEEL